MPNPFSSQPFLLSPLSTPPPAQIERIMAQGPVTPSRNLSKRVKGMKTVKKKLDDLKILCGTEAFLIYSCDGLKSVPEQLHALLPLVEKYESCIESGLHKMHNVPNIVEPLPEETTSLDLIQASSKQDHDLLRIGRWGEEDDVKPISEASKPHDDEEDLLLTMLNSLTGKNDLDSFSIEELQEIFAKIDSRVRTTQSNLKPLDLLGKFSEQIEYEKEIENGQNEKSHVVSFQHQHQLPSLLGKLAYETKEDAEIENKTPQSATARGSVRDMVQDYPLWQSSKENFRFILSGEQLESLEVRCKLPKGILEEQQNEVHSGTGNWEKSTMEQYSPLKKVQGVAGNNKGEKMDQVPCLTRDGDKFRLFLSGEQIDSLEVVGRFSTMVQNEQEREEPSLDLTL